MNIYIYLTFVSFKGIFVVPVSGTWRVSFSMRSSVYRQHLHLAYLYHNGEQMRETVYMTYSNSGAVSSTGGREILVTAQQGDTLSPRSGGLDYGFYHFLTCFEYNAV